MSIRLLSSVRAKVLGAGALAMVVLSGCGAIKLVAAPNIPTPLVSKIPVAVALYVPKEFAEYVHKEERLSTDWNVDLGKAQSDGVTRLITAMFERVEVVDSINAAAQSGSQVRAILEPTLEEYAFVTPRDAGSPFFAVSIKYRVNVYSPDGKLADSWGFTGYGTAPAQGLSNEAPLGQATALAMRDAAAKLATEFRDQAIVRGLMPESISLPDASVAQPTEQLPSTDAKAPMQETDSQPKPASAVPPIQPAQPASG